MVSFDNSCGQRASKPATESTAQVSLPPLSATRSLLLAGVNIAGTAAMTLSQYLGRGAVSRGRMTITEDLNTVVSTLPYLRNQGDIDAVIQGIEHLQAALANVKGLEFVYPAAGVSAADFVNTVSFSSSTCILSFITSSPGPIIP